MIFSRHNCALIVFSVLCSFYSNAQDKPIGYWESHLPYNNALGVATNGNTLFTVCNQAFFTLEGTNANATIATYGKESGMSDIGMQCVAYDMSTSTTILVYANGNIDLFKDNTFYNIPDLKVKTVAGNKSVNQVYAENGTAYLSTSLGVLVIDLTTHNITETFQFSLNNHPLPVNSFVGSGNYFYAATTGGLYRINKNNPALQNMQAWQRIDAVDTINSMATVSNTLFMATRQTVLALVGDTVTTVYRCAMENDSTITHIDPSDRGLLISEFHSLNYNGDVKLMNASFEITDTFSGLGSPSQVTQLLDNSLWVADGYYGLEKIVGNTGAVAFVPPGPSDPYSFDIYANNKDLWVAHGGYNDLFHANGDRNCISNYNAGKWKAYKQYEYPPFDTLTDFIGIAKNEKNGTFYFGSYLQGLFILKNDGSYEIVNTGVFDSSDVYFSNNQRQVTGLALDQSDNLWVSAIGMHQLYMLSADNGTWYKYHVPVTVNGGTMILDDNGQVWFTSISLSGGLTVFNDNQTPDNTADDTYQHLSAGVGHGNLPSNNVICLAKDKNNQIWVGTDNGIGIVSGCNPSGTNSTCDANIPIVQYDQFAGYLFAGNNVRTIAVDGANRKWVGTDAGVWLLSPDASQIIYRFTQDNSPLPSNNIQKISVDKVTGDVYIGTTQGLVCYHSTATEGGTSNQNVITFPNPVKSGYTGTIAIRGLVANADVRITDIDGQLVYKTKALGGQAVWNGRDYTGHRPQSGVYLIFSSGSDGAQTYQGKIVFMQ